MSPVSCVSSYLEEHKNPLWGGLFLLTSSKLLQKHNCTRPPLHQITHTLSGGPTSGAVSQSYLKRYLPGYSPHFTPNKT